MKIAIASDFSGFRLKEAVKAYLLEKGFSLDDIGQQTPDEGMLYYEASGRLAQEISRGTYPKGIVICGTGAGVSMIANKYKGVYCVACESLYTAEKISLINNANVLAMGERIVSAQIGCEMAEAFLTSIWCEGFDDARRTNNEKGFHILQQLEER